MIAYEHVVHLLSSSDPCLERKKNSNLSPLILADVSNEPSSAHIPLEQSTEMKSDYREGTCVPLWEQYLDVLEKVKAKLTLQYQLHPYLVIPR